MHYLLVRLAGAAFAIAAAAPMLAQNSTTFTGTLVRRELFSSYGYNCTEPSIPRVFVSQPTVPIPVGQTSFTIDTSNLNKCGFGSIVSGNWSFGGPAGPLQVTIQGQLSRSAPLTAPITLTSTTSGVVNLKPSNNEPLYGAAYAYALGDGRETTGCPPGGTGSSQKTTDTGNLSVQASDTCTTQNLTVTKTNTDSSGKLVSFEARYEVSVSLGIGGIAGNRGADNNNYVNVLVGVDSTFLFTTGPALSVGYPDSTQSLSFSTDAGAASFPVKSLTISNAGPGTLNWTAAASTDGGGNWLVIKSAKSGTAVSGAPAASLDVTVDVPATMQPGTYTGKVTITASSDSGPVAGSPVVVPVTLTVTGGCPAPQLRSRLRALDTPNCGDTVEIAVIDPADGSLMEAGSSARVLVSSVNYKLASSDTGTVLVEIVDNTATVLNQDTAQVSKGEKSVGPFILPFTVPANNFVFAIHARARLLNAGGTKIADAPRTVDYKVVDAAKLTLTPSIPPGSKLSPGEISINAQITGAMGVTPTGQLGLRLLDGSGNIIGNAAGPTYNPGDKISNQLFIIHAKIPDDVLSVALVAVITDSTGTVFLKSDNAGYTIGAYVKPSLEMQTSDNQPLTDPVVLSWSGPMPQLGCQVNIDNSLNGGELVILQTAQQQPAGSGADLGQATPGTMSSQDCATMDWFFLPPYAFSPVVTINGQRVQGDPVSVDAYRLAIDTAGKPETFVDSQFVNGGSLITGTKPVFHVPVLASLPRGPRTIRCDLNEGAFGTGSTTVATAFTGTVHVDVFASQNLPSDIKNLTLKCSTEIVTETTESQEVVYGSFVSTTTIPSGSGSVTTSDGEVTFDNFVSGLGRDLGKLRNSSEIQSNRTPARTQNPKLAPRLIKTAAPSGGAAVAVANFLGVGHTIQFDPPIPEDGSFESDLVIHYNRAWFPDDPNFSEANMVIVSLDPADGTLYSYPTTVNTQAGTATTHVRGLAAYYSLGVLGPFPQPTMNTIVLTGGGAASLGTAFVNIGKADANLQIAGYDSRGNGAASGVALPAGQQISSATQPALGVPPSGWSQARSDQAGVRGFALLSQGGPTIDSLPLDTAAGTNLVITGAESGCRLSLVNATNFTAQVTVELHGLDGGLLGSQALTLQPKSDWYGAVASVFPGVPTPLQGYIAVLSSARLGASLVWSSSDAVAAVNAVNADFATAGAKNYSAPLLTGGRGLTRLNFVNIGNAAANVTISAYSETGAPMGQPVQVQLAPGQQYWQDAAQALGLNASTVTAGSLSIVSDGPLAGDVALSDSAQVARTSLLFAEPAKSLVIPHVTGDMLLSIANPGDSAANVLVQVFGPDGSLTGSAPVPVPAKARNTALLASVVSAAAGQVGGHIELDATQSISALALIGGLTLGQDFGSIAAQAGLGSDVQIPTPPQPAIDAPVTVDFGSVTLGQTIAPKTFSIANKGTGTLTVSRLTAPGAPFSLVSPPPSTPFDVPASGMQLTVGFSPTAAGTFAGTLVIASNDAANPTWTVNLTGNVTAPIPSISLSSSSLSFGNVPIGQSPGNQVLTVTNTGAVAVTVTAKTSAPFSVAPASLQLPVGQSGTFTVTFTPTAASAASGSLVVSIGSPNDPAPVALSGTGFVPSTTAAVSRSLVYHEITRFAKDVRFNNGGQPVLSASGNRIVYANSPGDETDARYNDIFVVNADGSGQRLVDSYKQNCNCGAIVDISADGNTIVSTQGTELHLATATGSTGKLLIGNREIPWMRISPKGDKVFFIHRRGSASATDPNTERGLYVINADGSGLKQIAGPGTVLKQTGVTVDPNVFATAGWSLDVSADGSKLVFGTATAGGERIFSVNSDGTGLKQLMGPFVSVGHAALSGDGTKVGYDVTAPPCCSTPNEVGVINFDGSGRKALATNLNGLTGSLRMQLSSDGSKLLYGSSNRLYSTDGSGFMALSVQGGSFSTDPAVLIRDGLFLPTMDGAADRFVFASSDDANILQLATMDVNPASLGEAPSVSSPTLSTLSIALSAANAATVSAAVKTSDKVTRVSAAVLNGGVSDNHVNAPVMLDDGTQGDVVAGDGVYTSNQITADCCAALGPRTMRVKAEVRDSGNRRHATAIEFDGPTIVGTPSP